jgi:hypothetical protein
MHPKLSCWLHPLFTVIKKDGFFQLDAQKAARQVVNFSMRFMHADLTRIDHRVYHDRFSQTISTVEVLASARPLIPKGSGFITRTQAIAFSPHLPF